MAKYKVKQGDCISSIAYNNGFFPDTLWNHPDNAKLKQKRQKPNILMPGDEVFIPDKEERNENCPTEQKHRFRLKEVPVNMRIRLLYEDVPLANESYILNVNGDSFQGKTDDEGKLEHSIIPNAKQASILLGEDQQESTIELGRLDPLNEIVGIQKRLNNLGYDCGPEDGKLGPKTKAAIQSFQRENGLTEDGKPGIQTQKRLRSTYGC